MRRRSYSELSNPTIQDQEKKDKDDKEETAKRELFPSAPAEYRTFYTKEQNRGQEPRWKQQLASIEERTMQASTPQTAKKQSSSRKEIQELSQQLEEQILEAKATMTKMQVMQESAKVSDQPP